MKRLYDYIGGRDDGPIFRLSVFGVMWAVLSVSILGITWFNGVWDVMTVAESIKYGGNVVCCTAVVSGLLYPVMYALLDAFYSGSYDF